MAASDRKNGIGLKTWILVWGLGVAGQLCWNIENQWFNTFIYAKIARDPAIISWMVAVSAVATTFATFFFGTMADRKGTRKPFVAWGYIMWGVCTIAFGLTEFIPKEHLMAAAVSVVIADAVMSFFGSMGNDAGFNAWTNDMMREGNRGQIGAALATQPVIGTIVGTLLGGAIIGMIAGIVCCALISVPLNYYVTYPVYYNFMSQEAILGMYRAIYSGTDSILEALFIFNVPMTAGKMLINSAITLVVYKKLSNLIKFGIRRKNKTAAQTSADGTSGNVNCIKSDEPQQGDSKTKN